MNKSSIVISKALAENGLMEISTESLYKDSKLNEHSMKTLMALLAPYKIKSITSVRVHEAKYINVISSLPANDLKTFMQNISVKNKVLNYNQFSFYRFLSDRFDLSGDKLNALLTERKVIRCKYSILFCMDKADYEQLSNEELIKFHMMLISFYKLAFNMFRWNNNIPYLTTPEGDALDTKKPDLKHFTLKEHFQISDLEWEYLKMIVTGCTSKEIGLHVGKSYRYIQNIIANLQKKLGVTSKSQLEDMAKIILCEF
jgi:DNA-binding CsgD family transcriptional regulator